MQQPSIGLIDESSLTAELEAVVATSLDASVVKQVTESESGALAGLSAEVNATSPKIREQLFNSPGTDTRISGVGSMLPSAFDDINRTDLTVLVDGDILRVVGEGTEIEYGHIGKSDAGIQDWNRCLPFCGWTRKNKVEVCAIEIGETGHVSRISPIVFESATQARCPAVTIGDELNAFASQYIAFDDTDNQELLEPAAWLVAEIIELMENGYQVGSPMALGNGFAVTAAAPEATGSGVAIFCWNEEGGSRRMSAYSEQIDFDSIPAIGARLMSQIGQTFARKSSYADILIAGGRDDSLVGGTQSSSAILRQLGAASFVLEVSTPEGVQEVSLESIEEVRDQAIRQTAKACAEGIWNGQFRPCKTLFVGPAGACGVDQSGWSLLTHADIQRFGWSRVDSLTRAAFDNWHLPTRKLLPPTLQSPDQRRGLTSHASKGLGRLTVLNWETHKNAKTVARWQAHPMGLLIELAKSESEKKGTNE